MSEIGRALNKHAGSVHGVLAATGGIEPRVRKRSNRALQLSEREEISRGLGQGFSFRHMRCTELTLMATALAIAAAVQCVVSPGRFLQSHRDDARRNFIAQWRNTRFLGLVTQQSIDAFGHETLLPAPYRILIDASLALNLIGANAISRQQNDPSPPNMLLRAIAIRHNRFHSDTVRGSYFKSDSLAHPMDAHIRDTTGILNQGIYVRFYPLGANWRHRVEYVGAKPALGLGDTLII